MKAGQATGLLGRLAGAGLPWLLALLYLGMIGYLGLKFHEVAPYQVKQVMEHTEAGVKPVDLSLVRFADTRPTSMRLSLDFAAAADSGELAVFFPRMTSNANIFVNDQWLRGPPVTFRANYQYQPQWVPIPGTALRSGQANRLFIELRAEGQVKVLSQFYLGPALALEPTYRLFQFFRQDLLRGALAAAALLAVFMGTIWLARPQLKEFGWLALAFVGFCYYLYSFVGIGQPVFGPLYDWSFLLARALFVWSFMCFVHQFLSYQRRRMEVALGLFYLAVFATGLILVLSGRYFDFLRLTYVTSMPMVLLVIAYVNVVLLLALIKKHHVYLHWLLVGSLLGLLLGVHDVLVLFDVQHWLIRDFYISHYAIVFISVGYGGVLVHRVARALFSSEEMNVELNRLLALKSQALEVASQERVAAEKQLALYAERQRILADMHDGVGGQLVGLIAANRRGDIERDVIGGELDAILADLRLVLDALTPAGEDLVLALARLAERYRPLLGHAQINFHWSVQADIDALPMAPSRTVNLLRLVQEAVQNSVKHAAASNIWLTLERLDDGFVLTVRDDGAGIAPDSRPGHGSQTMGRRAAAVRGEVICRPASDGGTEVAVTFT